MQRERAARLFFCKRKRVASDVHPRDVEIFTRLGRQAVLLDLSLHFLQEEKQLGALLHTEISRAPRHKSNWQRSWQQEFQCCKIGAVHGFSRFKSALIEKSDVRHMHGHTVHSKLWEKTDIVIQAAIWTFVQSVSQRLWLKRNHRAVRRRQESLTVQVPVLVVNVVGGHTLPGATPGSSCFPRRWQWQSGRTCRRHHYGSNRAKQCHTAWSLRIQSSSGNHTKKRPQSLQQKFAG